MTTFLFWNLNGNSLEQAVAELAHEHRVDVLLLAECSNPTGQMLTALNDLRTEYHSAISLSGAITIYTRFPPEFLVPRRETGRLTIRALRLPAEEEILVAAAHLPGKTHWRDDSQWFDLVETSRDIRRTEEEAGHSRTLLVGDLNMNPFEAGMVSASGMHAVMTREIALRQDRTVSDRRYPYFYNPMWSFFGDTTSGPPGTHYYDRGQHVTYFWNMFDQVLIRPSLLTRFSTQDIRILTEVQGTSLLSRSGRPSANRFSDHLPILFKLNI